MSYSRLPVLQIYCNNDVLMIYNKFVNNFAYKLKLFSLTCLVCVCVFFDQGTELEVDLFKKRSSEYAAAKELAIKGNFNMFLQFLLVRFKIAFWLSCIHLSSFSFSLPADYVVSTVPVDEFMSYYISTPLKSTYNTDLHSVEKSID